MATIQLLTLEELQARERKPKGKGRTGRRRSPERQQIIDQFKQALHGVAPGFGGDVTLVEGEEKRVVRLNLKEAAREIDLHLAFRPIKDKSRITFRIITAEEQAARPRRGGRPRKAQPEDSQAPTSEPPPAPAAPAPRRGRRKKEPQAA